jgi:hypothetical protein
MTQVEFGAIAKDANLDLATSMTGSRWRAQRMARERQQPSTSWPKGLQNGRGIFRLDKDSRIVAAQPIQIMKQEEAKARTSSGQDD